jgi:hypothetical protein
MSSNFCQKLPGLKLNDLQMSETSRLKAGNSGYGELTRRDIVAETNRLNTQAETARLTLILMAEPGVFNDILLCINSRITVLE